MFLFGKKKKEPKGLVKAQPSAAQKRSSFRMPVEFDVLYTLRDRPGRRHARAHDLSAGGLRLACDEDFLRNSVLTLEFHLPDDFLADMMIEKEVFEQTPFGLRPEMMRVQPPPFIPMCMTGTVLSTFFNPDQRCLAHGLQFVEINEPMQEELQRFIHLWQLSFLRKRNESE